MKIKAWAVRKPKEDLKEFVYEKTLGKNDVLIKVDYCSFVKADVFFIDNFWNDTKYPLIPSSEVFGTVVKTGAGVKSIKAGDYAGVGYQVYSCKKCIYCTEGKEQYCSKQKVIGVHEYGGLAEYMIADSDFVYSIPLKLRKPENVSLMCYGLTAYSAIKHSSLNQQAETGVIGIGNLGHISVQILVKMGFPVTAFTHSKNKQKILKKSGIKSINPLNKKELNRHKSSFDFLLVTTYHDYEWSDFIPLLKPEGRLHFIGLPEKNISFPAVMLADYARKQVSGSYIGSRQDMKELLSFVEKNNISINSELFPVSQVNKLADLLRKNKVAYNSVINI